MARIAGVDLPPNKRAEVGLTYIYGIGRSRASSVLTEASVSLLRVRLRDRDARPEPAADLVVEATTRTIRARAQRHVDL